MKNKSVYLLKVIHPSVHRDGKKGHYHKTKDGCFECWQETVGIFSSIMKAEETIRKLVKKDEDDNLKWNNWIRFVGFTLKELHIDDTIDEYGNICHFESEISYLSDGTFNCMSECDDRCKKKFNGTLYPNVHVRKGDVALELCGDVLMPVLVESTSMTKDEWKKNFKKGVKGDFTDDSGLAFSAYNGHVHPFAPNLFPMSCLPYANITKKDMQKMDKMRDDYFMGVAI